MQTMTDTVSAPDLLAAAKGHLDEHGYCIVEGAISRAQADAPAHRGCWSRREAEAQIGIERILGDRKQLVGFLLNKGQGFSRSAVPPGHA